MEPINEKNLLESVEKAAFEGAKAGAKEGRKTSIVAKAGGKLASRILVVLLVIAVAMALFPKINVLYKVKQELGFDKNVSGYDLTIDNNGIFGYTAADFAEVVLGDASKLKKIEVYERDVTDVATITNAGLLKIKLFSKSQDIKYSGVATYVVDISDDGEVVCDHLSPKQMLDKMRFLCKGKTEPIPEVYRQFNKETRDGRDMSKYSGLLGKAIASIIEVKDESDIDSFLGGGQVSFLTNEFKGLDDFELICFLVVR